MERCPSCGQKVTDLDVFCSMCGTSLQTGTRQTHSDSESSVRTNDGSSSYTSLSKPQQNFDQQSRNYSKKINTWQLSIIIFLIWLSIALLGLGTLITFFVIPLIAVLFFVLILIQYYFAKGLAEHDDTARVIFLFFTALSLVFSLFGFLAGDGSDLISLLISIFVIYTLAFHQETLALFKASHIRRSSY